MYIEPRPAGVRDAVLGLILIVVGAYVGGIAIWSWLFWADQHLDTPRVVALFFALMVIPFGVDLIRRWVSGEWFEGGRSTGGSSSGSSGWSSDVGSGCDSGPGSGDGGSCQG